jgi:hypothetical protein
MPRRKQGRYSAEDQRKVAPEATLPPPDPPPELEAPEAAIWRAITAKLPGDWFAPETSECRFDPQVTPVNIGTFAIPTFPKNGLGKALVRSAHNQGQRGIPRLF